MNRLLQDWLGEQAKRRPEAIALVMRQERITYRELDECTNRLAALLIEAGCQRGDRICFAIPKSPAAIIAILGILKADCIHVPIETNSPAARVAKILSSTEPRYILAVGSSAQLLDELFTDQKFRESIAVGWMENSIPSIRNFTPLFFFDDLKRYSAQPVNYRNSQHDIAHILFTSGSTGDPKGVVITHANVIHFIDWAAKYFGMDSSDRLSCHAPLHFDLAYLDIFGAFATGAELHLVPPELNLLPNKLADFIRASKLTQWFSVPSVFNYLARFDAIKFNDFPTLKRVLWCGDVLSTRTLIYWMKRLPNVAFSNLYGPTETTIASSYYTLLNCPEDERTPIPIGTPCDGEELLVLDEKLQPVPTGEVGELYIGGVGLSPAYWSDAEKTGTAFIHTNTGRRIYKTGDLAWTGADGLTYFAGRADSQIKSWGRRIELGEIETALNTCQELEQSAVVAIHGNDLQENLICCAYVAPDGVCNLSMLQGKLSRLLPRYMVPVRWMRLGQLPVNANGKVDRRGLREMFSSYNTTHTPPLQEDVQPTVSTGVID